MPSRFIVNECRAADQPDCLKNMTEAESTMIAKNFQFRKIYRLPRSGIAQIRARVINIPVPSRNIKATIESLPRTPSDSGLIGINWRRKKSLKNIHLQPLVDRKRILDALQYLVDYNPLYKDS